MILILDTLDSLIDYRMLFLTFIVFQPAFCEGQEQLSVSPIAFVEIMDAMEIPLGETEVNWIDFRSQDTILRDKFNNTKWVRSFLEDGSFIDGRIIKKNSKNSGILLLRRGGHFSTFAEVYSFSKKGNRAKIWYQNEITELSDEIPISSCGGLYVKDTIFAYINYVEIKNCKEVNPIQMSDLKLIPSENGSELFTGANLTFISSFPSLKVQFSFNSTQESLPYQINLVVRSFDKDTIGTINLSRDLEYLNKVDENKRKFSSTLNFPQLLLLSQSNAASITANDGLVWILRKTTSLREITQKGKVSQSKLKRKSKDTKDYKKLQSILKDIIYNEN